MKKSYTVYVHYEGCIVYRVSADSEEAAQEIAENVFAEEDADKLAENLADIMCDCEEEDNKKENDKMADENVMVKIVRNGNGSIVPFFKIKKGDYIVAFNVRATSDAHYSGDASYDGYLFYADDDSYFPEDFAQYDEQEDAE